MYGRPVWILRDRQRANTEVRESRHKEREGIRDGGGGRQQGDAIRKIVSAVDTAPKVGIGESESQGTTDGRWVQTDTRSSGAMCPISGPRDNRVRGTNALAVPACRLPLSPGPVRSCSGDDGMLVSNDVEERALAPTRGSLGRVRVKLDRENSESGRAGMSIKGELQRNETTAGALDSVGQVRVGRSAALTPSTLSGSQAALQSFRAGIAGPPRPLD
ncbi:hypothetical protein B0H11DRAFT_1937297 [Mycena galericulata]|nr:hypothetical protein B0H11DRAFT_1937297 [Mycena galericulata]